MFLESSHIFLGKESSRIFIRLKIVPKLKGRACFVQKKVIKSMKAYYLFFSPHEALVASLSMQAPVPCSPESCMEYRLFRDRKI